MKTGTTTTETQTWIATHARRAGFLVRELQEWARRFGERTPASSDLRMTLQRLEDELRAIREWNRGVSSAELDELSEQVGALYRAAYEITPRGPIVTRLRKLRDVI